MKIRFKSNMDGFREIRYSEPVREMLEQIGEGVADTCNQSLTTNGATDPKEGYTVTSQPGRKVRQGRWRVSVTAASVHAIRHNAVHNTLLRALGGAK